MRYAPSWVPMTMEAEEFAKASPNRMIDDVFAGTRVEQACT